MSRTMFLRVAMFVFAFMFLLTCVWAAEWVDFKGKSPGGDKLQLRGILHTPKGEGPFPAVVMLYTCGGLKEKNDVKHQKVWVKQLVSWGYVALQVDSFGPRNHDNICNNTEIINDLMRSSDAYSAKAYLSKLAFVDPQRIAVIGWSHGGWAVMKIVDGKFRDKDSTPFQAAVAFYPWCETIVKFDTPLLILIGEKDDWCPASRCEVLTNYQYIKESPHEFILKIYPGAYHCFDFKGLNEDVLDHHLEYNAEVTADAITQIEAFLAKHLSVTK